MNPLEQNLMYIILLVFALIFGAILFVSLKKKKRPTHELPREVKPSELKVDLKSEASVPLETVKEDKVSEDDFKQSRSVAEALSQTEKNFWGRIKTAFTGEANNKPLEEIEEVLYTSDLGPSTVTKVLEVVEEELSRSEKANPESIKAVIKNEFLKIFDEAHITDAPNGVLSNLNQNSKPAVWMIVGVNGAGKTTSIGKIAALLAQNGKKVLVAAGDTFRAAAGNQLKTWTDRAQVEIFYPPQVTDPSALAFDAVSKAKAGGYDVVIIDTAGRLHTQAHLMEELKKVKRVIQKVLPEAPHETLIVLDANSGQNALIQAKEFNQALTLSGVILTKMDGTAKGGVAVGLCHELKIPIRLIGVGEKIGDLRPFSAKEFVDAVLR